MKIVLLSFVALAAACAADTRAGAKLYHRECAACHGEDRQGRDKAPPLNHPGIYQADPEKLFQILRNGRLLRGMPSFAHLPEAQRRQIIAYLQSPAVRGAALPPPSIRTER